MVVRLAEAHPGLAPRAVLSEGTLKVGHRRIGLARVVVLQPVGELGIPGRQQGGVCQGNRHQRVPLGGLASPGRRLRAAERGDGEGGVRLYRASEIPQCGAEARAPILPLALQPAGDRRRLPLGEGGEGLGIDLRPGLDQSRQERCDRTETELGQRDHKSPRVSRL